MSVVQGHQLMPDRATLLALAAQRRDTYRTAQPFPHIVIDDLLPQQVAQQVLDEFPEPDARWIHFDSEREKKFASPDDTTMGPTIRAVLNEFNAAPMIDFLTELTGLNGLVPDPHFEGGGMHQILPGGHLEVHADFNLHPRTKLLRRLNLLLYLNHDWRDEYAGHLELWSRDMSSCVARIAPVFNRCVIFATNDDSFHGHPHPLACPDGMSRKSLALYYYTSRDEQSVVPHNTLFQSTREGQSRTAQSETSASVRHLAGRWAPPALADAIRRARRRRTGT